MKKNLFKKTVISMCILLIFSSITVFATTFMTYSGTGIRGKYSNNSFTLSNQTVVYIQHTNNAWNDVGEDQKVMEIQVHKKNSVGYYSQVPNKLYRVSGVRSLTDYFTLESGTYKLYFHAPYGPAAASISGQVID